MIMRKTLVVVAAVLFALLFFISGCSRGDGDSMAGGAKIYSAKGRIQLPEGSALAMSDLTVLGCLSSVTPANDGSFRVDEPDTGPALVLVRDREGHLILMGFVDGTDDTVAEISAKSTAAAILFQQLCVYTLLPSAWKEALAVLMADANTAALANVIAARLAANPAVFEDQDAGIRAAVTAAAEALLPAPMRAASGRKPASRQAKRFAAAAASGDVAAIVVTSEPLQSGIQVGANPDGDGIILTNNYRRHAWYWVYVTGYQNADGQDVPYGIGQWVDVTNGYLSATNGLAGALGATLDAWYDNVAYKPVNTSPIGISLVPGNAKKVYMAVVTASYGRKSQTLPGPITGDAQKESSWYKGHEGMLGVGLVKDFLFPAIFTFVPANALGRLTGKQLTDLSWDLIGACTQAGFDATASLATLDWNGASWAIIKGVATDEKLRETVGALIATRVLSNYSSKTSGLIAGSAKLLMKALKVIDYAYLGIDYVAIERDCARSDTYNYFTLTAVPPVVRIEPSPACVHPGMPVNLTTYKNIATAGSYTYSYSTKGKYGTLSAGAQSGIAFDSTSETVTYNCKPDAAVGATETVKVVVERRIVTDSGYQMNTIGEATVNITVTAPAITIDPPVKSVSANSAAEFAARYDDAVSTDTRLMYHWTNTGKAGHLLDASSAASDDFTTSSATVAYVAGTSAGNDTVTVEVLLVVDGKSYPQGKAAALVTVTNDNYKTAGERRVIWKVVQTTTSGDPTRFDMTAMYLVVWKKPPTVYPYYAVTVHTHGKDGEGSGAINLDTDGEIAYLSNANNGIWDRARLEGLCLWPEMCGHDLLKGVLADDELAMVVIGFWTNASQNDVNFYKARFYDWWVQDTAGWTYDVEGSLKSFQ